MAAHMIPPEPRDFDPASREGDVFRALKKLSDKFYVFHSVPETVVSNDTIYEREIDFVIAHEEKGILCLEVKAGANIKYVDRTWKYSNGTVMKHGGPYNQVATAKRTILDKIRSHPNEDVRSLENKCKIYHGVFFIDVAENDFLSFTGLPSEADSRITLFVEDMINPSKKINEIFNLEFPSDKYISNKETMSEDEFKLLLDSILCPHFNLIPSPKSKQIFEEERMNQLLREQYKILEFLDEQKSAVINGAAGTGKTMVAVEKARRHSENGEKVLFLCYNRMLCDNLIETHKKSESKTYNKMFKNVEFMTISKLTQEATGNYKDYDGLYKWLDDCFDDFSEFGYNHVIIDEGQDFGIVDAEIGLDIAKINCSIIDQLQLIMQENGGTFYLFYDKYQMIQGSDYVNYELPDCINDCDCRLTLHKNCRNTWEIAKTSVTPLKDKKSKAISPSTAYLWGDSTKPNLHIVKEESDYASIVNSILEKYSDNSIEDVVILTLNTTDNSNISNYSVSNPDEVYDEYQVGNKLYKFTTCKKFKGLEADAIIIVDLNHKSFSGKNGMQFYVGSSRAKHQLDMVCLLNDQEIAEVISVVAPNSPKTSDLMRQKKILGNAFGVEIVEH